MALPKKINNSIDSGRLKKRPEFLFVAKNGQKWVSESVIVQKADNKNIDMPRFGYTATKRIGNAVIRNRSKRRMRAAVQNILTDYSIQSSDINLIARNNTATCSWDCLIKDLKWCLKRLDILVK